MSDGRIASLHRYPLKGGRAIDVDALALGRFGPVDDRRWMVVDPDGSLVTQREVPALCMMTARPELDALHLSAPGGAGIAIRRPAHDAPRREVRVWKDRFEAIDLGAQAAAWCSTALNREVGLVYLPDDAGRRTDPAYDPAGAPVSFADGYPLLVVGAGSLAELNRRLAVPLPMTRFRPNVVIDGLEPHEEDGWRSFEMGGIRCDGVKLCARCVVTTTDQLTADRGVEPLRTLATYRRREAGVMFGMNVVHRDSGVLRIGMPVTVTARWSTAPV